VQAKPIHPNLCAWSVMRSFMRGNQQIRERDQFRVFRDRDLLVYGRPQIAALKKSDGFLRGEHTDKPFGGFLNVMFASIEKRNGQCCSWITGPALPLKIMCPSMALKTVHLPMASPKGPRISSLGGIAPKRDLFPSSFACRRHCDLECFNQNGFVVTHRGLSCAMFKR